MGQPPIRKARAPVPDMVTLDSPTWADDEMLDRAFPKRTAAAKVERDFILPRQELAGEGMREAVAATFGPRPGADHSSLAGPAIGRLAAMSERGPGRGDPGRITLAATPKQIIASGGRLGRLSVADNPAANPDAPWVENPDFQEVTQNERHIADSAAKYGIDPDLLRSVIWVESTHGWYDRPLEPFDANKSIRPANINTQYWGDIWGSREDLKDPAKNIAAGANMLKSVATAMPKASIASQASIYNNDRADKVSDFGARVQKIYEQKPWKNWKPRAPGSYRSGDRG